MLESELQEIRLLDLEVVLLATSNVLLAGAWIGAGPRNNVLGSVDPTSSYKRSLPAVSETLLRLVLDLAFIRGLPLHVRRFIGPTTLERLHMIDDISGTRT